MNITTVILKKYIKYKNKLKDLVRMHKMKEMLNLICLQEDAAVQSSHLC